MVAASGSFARLCCWNDGVSGQLSYIGERLKLKREWVNAQKGMSEVIGEMGHDSRQTPAPAIGTNRWKAVLLQFVVL